MRPEKARPLAALVGTETEAVATAEAARTPASTTTVPPPNPPPQHHAHAEMHPTENAQRPLRKYLEKEREEKWGAEAQAGPPAAAAAAAAAAAVAAAEAAVQICSSFSPRFCRLRHRVLIARLGQPTKSGAPSKGHRLCRPQL